MENLSFRQIRRLIYDNEYERALNGIVDILETQNDKISELENTEESENASDKQEGT